MSPFDHHILTRKKKVEECNHNSVQDENRKTLLVPILVLRCSLTTTLSYFLIKISKFLLVNRLRNWNKLIKCHHPRFIFSLSFFFFFCIAFLCDQCSHYKLLLKIINKWKKKIKKKCKSSKFNNSGGIYLSNGFFFFSFCKNTHNSTFLDYLDNLSHHIS